LGLACDRQSGQSKLSGPRIRKRRIERVPGRITPAGSFGSRRKREESIMLNSWKRRLSTACGCCTGPFAATAVSRRQMLAGGTAALAVGAVGGFARKSFAQGTPRRIDVHHHLAAPSWLQAMSLIGADNPPIAHWSVQ